MDDLFAAILIAIFACFVGAFGSWVATHETVATECKKLGAIYVGQTVYECKEKK